MHFFYSFGYFFEELVYPKCITFCLPVVVLPLYHSLSCDLPNVVFHNNMKDIFDLRTVEKRSDETKSKHLLTLALKPTQIGPIEK